MLLGRPAADRTEGSERPGATRVQKTVEAVDTQLVAPGTAEREYGHVLGAEEPDVHPAASAVRRDAFVGCAVAEPFADELGVADLASRLALRPVHDLGAGHARHVLTSFIVAGNYLRAPGGLDQVRVYYYAAFADLSTIGRAKGRPGVEAGRPSQNRSSRAHSSELSSMTLAGRRT